MVAVKARFWLILASLFILSGVGDLGLRIWDVHKRLEAMHMDPAKASAEISTPLTWIAIGIIPAAIGSVAALRNKLLTS
jgi:hypothetical protein